MTDTAQQAGTDPIGPVGTTATGVAGVRLGDVSAGAGRAKPLIPDALSRAVMAGMVDRLADDEKHAAPPAGSW